VNPLPQTKRQLKKARKIKRLQEAGEVERNKRLQEIRTKVIQNLSKEEDLRPCAPETYLTKYSYLRDSTPVTV